MIKSKIQNIYPHCDPHPLMLICALCLFCYLLPTNLILGGIPLLGENFYIWNSFLYAQEPSKEEETLFLAKKAFEDRFYDVSLGLLERFLKNYPASSWTPEAYLLIGQCYFYQNRFLDALKKLEELSQLPGAKKVQDAAFYWIAEVHFRANNFSGAAQYYRKIIELFPSSDYCASAYYSLGWCLFQEGRFKEALGYFDVLEKKFPQAPLVQDASFKIIECLYNLHDYSGLSNKLNVYLKAYPRDSVRLPYVYFYLAEADYYLNAYEAAINHYAQALASSQDNRIQELSKLGMGWTYLKMKQYQQAGNKFSEAKAEILEKSVQDILSLGKATLLFETKNIPAAKNAYRQLLKTALEPAVAIQAYLGEADSLYDLGEYAEAITTYRQALEKAAGETTSQEIVDKLHYGLAWAFLKEGEFKNAIDEFKKVVQDTEDKIVKIAALCQIGDAYQDSGDFTKAAQTYDNIIKNYPDSLYADYLQYQVGVTLLKAANYDGAVLAFETLKKQFPNSKLLDDAVYALGLTYFQKEDYSASKDIFADFMQNFKGSNLLPQAAYLLGSSLYNLGKYNEALEVFKNIVRLSPRDTDLIQKAEYEIADCYYQLGNEKEAMENFKVLRVKYPDAALSAEVIWWLAEYYYRHNDLKEARRYLTSLIRDFPKNNLLPHAWYALGSISEQEAAYAEAIDNYQKVMQLARSDLAGTAALAIADVYIKQNRLDEALKVFQEVSSEHSNLAHLAYPKMAQIYQKRASYAEALNFYRKSLDLVPVREASNIQFKIAEVLQAEGKIPQAIEEYLKVTYLYTENDALAVKSLLRVAAIYEDQENTKEALKIYNKILSFNREESKYAQERIDRINVHLK